MLSIGSFYLTVQKRQYDPTFWYCRLVIHLKIQHLESTIQKLRFEMQAKIH
jgi:hypothetical protein